MATKASSTLVLIIERQHASWGLMVTALPGLELHFWCQLRIASARPILGPSGPCARMVVHVYVELFYGLPLASIPSSGLLRLAWQQLDSCIAECGCRLASCGAPPAFSGASPRRVCVRWSLRSQNRTFSLYQ